MATVDHSPKVESILQKLAKLRERQNSLEKENATLKERSSELELKLKELSDRNRVLQKDYDRVKLAKTLIGSTSEKAEMKFRVNELVREIDKCIALLNR